MGKGPEAAKRVLSYDEARSTDRLVFLETDGRELILDPSGKEMNRFVGYKSSKDVRAFLASIVY